MSWTKEQLIREAYQHVGLASYIFDARREDLESAMKRMDAMVAGWTKAGININYPMSGSPENSTLSTETNIPDWAAEAIYMNLGLRIASAHGKAITAELKTNARDAYRNVLREFSKPEEMQLPETLPRGMGNRPEYYSEEYFDTPYDPYQPWDRD